MTGKVHSRRMIDIFRPNGRSGEGGESALGVERGKVDGRGSFDVVNAENEANFAADGDWRRERRKVMGGGRRRNNRTAQRAIVLVVLDGRYAERNSTRTYCFPVEKHAHSVSIKKPADAINSTYDV